MDISLFSVDGLLQPMRPNVSLKPASPAGAPSLFREHRLCFPLCLNPSGKTASCHLPLPKGGVASPQPAMIDVAHISRVLFLSPLRFGPVVCFSILALTRICTGASPAALPAFISLSLLRFGLKAYFSISAFTRFCYRPCRRSFLCFCKETEPKKQIQGKGDFDSPFP